ncbi:hypothetical protein [Winogradskyella bathintestinalis]|uniref:Uncharacterized protein n=1 Tax=Winogradskyella bathintestinalis TaxID=3035208 RepID=A0ABT7ZWL0_9FLAO|nr:hypothetical protein [Winogradskyella bathintestinalis]MDN3493398.1 hypothetical protein [Winogradskyella bathintestinalis]
MAHEIKAYIKDDHVLYVIIADQSEYALLFTTTYKFIFKPSEGYKIEFIEVDDNSISEIKFIQLNGTFVAKPKIDDKTRNNLYRKWGYERLLEKLVYKKRPSFTDGLFNMIDCFS